MIQNYSFSGDQQIACHGYYFEYVSGYVTGKIEAPINVFFDGKPGGVMMPGDFRILKSPFKSVEIKSSVVQNGIVLAGEQTAGSRRSAGLVSSIDGTVNLTLEGNQYYMGAHTLTASGKYGALCVENKSGRDLIMRRATATVSTKMGMYIYSADGDCLRTLQATYNVYQKNDFFDSILTGVTGKCFSIDWTTETPENSFSGSVSMKSRFYLDTSRELFAYSPVVLKNNKTMMIVGGLVTNSISLVADIEVI